MVVGNDEVDTAQAACLERKQEVLPRRTAFAVGHLDGEHLAPAVPVNANRNQHRLAHHDASLPDLLVAGVEDEIGERLGKRAAGKSLQALLEPLVDGRDRRGGEGVAAQLFRDRLDLAGRNALHIHLRQRCHQRPLGTLVALEQLGGEMARTVLRHAQLQLAHPREQRAPVMARAIAKPLRRAFALRSAQGLVHLGFKHLLHHRADRFPQSVGVRKQNVFDGGAGGPTFLLGHGGFLSRESGDFNITSLP